jgi:hypothetical protein
VDPRGKVVEGPGGAQVLYEDPAGNLIEVFQPAAAKVGGGRTKAPARARPGLALFPGR